MSRILAEDVVEMVSAHDSDGTFRYASPVLAELVGVAADKIVGRHPREFAHEDDAESLAALFRRAATATKPVTTTWRCRRPSGLYAWIESSARAKYGDDTGPVVCASRDVTERRQIEDALRESEQRFRSTVETVRLVAVGLDVNGRITFCNDSLCTLLGYRRSELLGESWFEKILPPDSPSRPAFFENIKRGTFRPKVENEVICRDGSHRTIEWDTTVLRNSESDILGTASLGVDVTEQREEQATLKLLQSTALSISSATDVGNALMRTLEALCTATGWNYGEAWCMSDDSRIERTTYFAGANADCSALIDAGAEMKFAVGEGLPGRAWAARDVVWITDIETEGEHAGMQRKPVALECGFRAAVAIPVLAENEVVALLEFFMDRPRATDLRHTQTVEVIANQAGSLIARRIEQKRHEDELRRARDEAEAASHAKSDFLSRMSHELRTPLNSVIGFANVLRKNKGGRMAPDDIAFLERITANGKHLLSLVNNVLDIAKIEAGRLTVTTGLVNVDQLILDVVSSLEGQPRATGVALKAEVPRDVLPIESDSVLIKQVLINLTSNAIRFTKEGSVVVKLEVAKDETPLRIHVRDTGIGIAAERHTAIFEPFEQADTSTHQQYGGTGLGLSISRAICDALGFRLTLESAPGNGSTFTVHLT